MGPECMNIHASCVALDSQNAVLILGRSGAGKSALALGLMALGAHLVADDRVDLVVEKGNLFAHSPAAIAGQIEARQIGILRASALKGGARVGLVVDLDRTEEERLPPMRHQTIAGVSLPLVLQVQHGHLEYAVLQYLKGGRIV
ncbi:serine kinase [Rhodobacteraceae bacterium]|nr:serine kinase [Paracoccaceae bacterium]